MDISRRKFLGTLLTGGVLGIGTNMSQTVEASSHYITPTSGKVTFEEGVLGNINDMSIQNGHFFWTDTNSGEVVKTTLDGTEKWREPMFNDYQNSRIISTSSDYIGTGGQYEYFYLMDHDGNVVLERDVADTFDDSGDFGDMTNVIGILIDGDTVYVGGRSGQLFSIDIPSNSRNWKYNSPLSNNNNLNPRGVYDGVLYVKDGNDGAAEVDISDGSTINSTTDSSHPIVSETNAQMYGNRIYGMRSNETDSYKHNLDTGETTDLYIHERGSYMLNVSGHPNEQITVLTEQFGSNYNHPDIIFYDETSGTVLGTIRLADHASTGYFGMGIYRDPNDPFTIYTPDYDGNVMKLSYTPKDYYLKYNPRTLVTNTITGTEEGSQVSGWSTSE